MQTAARFSVARLLLADDSPDDVMLLQRLLGKHGVQAEIVSNGKQAVEHLERCLQSGAPTPLPQLLFLDGKMPFLTGFEVLEWIRARPALDGIGIVMLSSSAEPADLDQARSLGANAYFKKFPSIAEMGEVLAAVAQLEQPIGRVPLRTAGLL